MNRKTIERILSIERLEPYLKRHSNNFDKAVDHYKANIEISELSFGFWTSLLDSKFEKSLWKNLRLAFSNCPKRIRQRKTMSSKFNGVRRLRNRIFHHESITWSIPALINYKQEIIEGIDWLDKGLLDWSHDIFRIDDVIKKRKGLIQ